MKDEGPASARSPLQVYQSYAGPVSLMPAAAARPTTRKLTTERALVGVPALATLVTDLEQHSAGWGPGPGLREEGGGWVERGSGGGAGRSSGRGAGREGGECRAGAPYARGGRGVWVTRHWASRASARSKRSRPAPGSRSWLAGSPGGCRSGGRL